MTVSVLFYFTSFYGTCFLFACNKKTISQSALIVDCRHSFVQYGEEKAEEGAKKGKELGGRSRDLNGIWHDLWKGIFLKRVGQGTS